MYMIINKNNNNDIMINELIQEFLIIISINS